MRRTVVSSLLLLVTTTAFGAISPEDFQNFANAAQQFEQNASSSHQALRNIHHSYMLASSPDVPLTADSFPEIAASEAGLAAQIQLRDDAVNVLGSYAALLATLAENAPADLVGHAASQLRSDVRKLENDGRDLASAPGVVQAGDQMAGDARAGSPVPSQIDAKVVTEVRRLEQALGMLAKSKFHLAMDQPEALGLRLIATGVDEVVRAVEKHKHDAALLAMLRTMPPDIDRLTAYIAESTDEMKAAKDQMMTIILARANGIRPAYGAPARLQFDGDMASLLAANRSLGPLLDSVSNAATQFRKAHSELLLVAQKKDTPRAALRSLAGEVLHGYKFYRSIQSSEGGLPLRPQRRR